jgi:hypothetical protein
MELVRSFCPINGGPPTKHGGRAPALIVSRPAQRSLHVTACMLAKSPERPSTPEAPTASFPPPPLTIASGWSEPSSRAGLSPAVDQRLFTAHPIWGFTAYREPLGRRLRDLPGQWIDAAVASSQLKSESPDPEVCKVFLLHTSTEGRAD